MTILPLNPHVCCHESCTGKDNNEKNSILNVQLLCYRCPQIRLDTKYRIQHAWQHTWKCRCSVHINIEEKLILNDVVPTVIYNAIPLHVCNQGAIAAVSPEGVSGYQTLCIFEPQLPGGFVKQQPSREE